MPKIDVETFARRWGSQADLTDRFDVRGWMEKSYTDPLSFWEELVALYPLEPSSQTIPFEKYDFYADCILRHVGKNQCALKVIQEGGETESWTYDQLHALVGIQASLWKLKAGQTVALILPQGLPFLIGLMTALRLGLVVSILPINDRFFPESRFLEALEALKPDLIVTASEMPLEDPWNILHLDLSLERQSSASVPSHAYLPNDPVQKHFNPYAKEKICLVEAIRSYLIPLRDSLIALNLKSSTTWARPLSSMSRDEPCCTLMALLAGATIIYASDDLLLANPGLLKEEPIELLGVSFPLQQLWIKNVGCPASGLKRWYRDPLCGNDHNWKAFNELNQLQKIPSAQLLIDKDRGGVTLLSQPKPLEIISFMHPSPGTSWNLLKIQGTGDKAAGGFGLFQIEPATKNKDPLILSQIGDEWALSSTTAPLAEGVPYPIPEVEEKVKTLDFVLTCMLVTEPHPQHFLNRQFILLVFVSPKERLLLQQKKELWNQKIQDLIRTDIGEAFTPTDVQFYSFYPKMKSQEIDRHWIEIQYQNGSLFLKQNRSIYNLLNDLRQSIYENMAYKTNK